MLDRDKIQKEAELYKNVSTSKLRRTILTYKFLSLSNSRNYNFILSFLSIFVPYLIFVNVTLFTLSLVFLFHYFVLWKYMYLNKNSNLVSDEDKDEIDAVIVILEGYLKNR